MKTRQWIGNERLGKLAAIAIAALAALCGSAYATQPPDVVQSDAQRNTAMGGSALLNLTTGESNTASGYDALYSNTYGHRNTASGAWALYSNTTALYNTALGYAALYANTTGSYNLGLGPIALYSNTTGSGNSASGPFALQTNTTGNNNTAAGYAALIRNSTGSNNIGLGYMAGYWVDGSNNIDIGHYGYSAESGAIRIGMQGTQTAAYVAGILGAQVTGSAVYISPSGQLGVLASSERYKTDVMTMDSNSAKLRQLRPVKFRLKTDRDGPVQYGLMAEEVDKVYPELVIRDAQGRIEGVRYEELAPMLLNEVQQDQRRLVDQAQRMASQDETIATLARRLADQDVRIAARARELQDVRQQLVQIEELRLEIAALRDVKRESKASQVKLEAF